MSSGAPMLGTARVVADGRAMGPQRLARRINVRLGVASGDEAAGAVGAEGLGLGLEVVVHHVAAELSPSG
jgi:hypothetical protein